MYPHIAREDYSLDQNDFFPDEYFVPPCNTAVQLSPVTKDHETNQQTSHPGQRRPRRVQLQLLRNEVAQLEAIHDVLSRRGAEFAEHSDPDALLEDGFWRQVADEQFNLLEQAMRDNLRLREELASIRELDKRVRRQLAQQEAQLEAQLAANECQCVCLSSRVTAGLDAFKSPVHIDMMGVLFRMYHQTTSVVESLRQQLDLQTAHVRDIHFNDQRDTLDIVDARIVPFDHRSTADAIWEWMFCDRTTFRNALIERDIAQDGSMHMSFVGEIGSGLQWVHCRWDLVLRRFDEVDRVVLVTSVRGDADRIDLVDVDMTIKHNQWVVISHNPLSGCSEIVCRDVSRLSDSHGLLSFVQTCVQEHHNMMHVFVDSKLIDKNRSSNNKLV